MAQSTDPTSIYSDGQRRTAPPPGLQSDDSKDGHEVEHVSMFGKAKNKAKKLRDKVKGSYKAQNGHPSDHKEEEEKEEEETVEGVDHEKPDENVDDVTKGMAGLGGLGTAKKDDRGDQGSEKANKTTLGDVLGRNDSMSTEETMKESEGPDDELRHKDGMLTEEKENPQEGLSSFKETGQGRRKRGDDIFTTQEEQTGTDVGTPSIPQRAAQAMPGATGGIIGLGEGNKQEESSEEKPNSSEFDEPPLGLKEETMKENEGPDDDLRHKDGMLTEEKENPQEGLSSFRETGRGRSERGDDIFTTKKEQTGTDVGTPSIPQRVAQAMAGATGGIIGVGKGNKQEESSEEKPKSSEFDEPPLGLKEETMKESEGPDDKDGMLTEGNENPQEGLSSFRETGQGRSKRGDDIFTTQEEQTGTDVGTPSIPQRAAQAMPGTTGGIIGLGKGNKLEENSEEKPNSSEFDEPPLGLKEVPKPLEEEFQSLQEKSNKDPQNDVGEGNGLSSNEKLTEEVESHASVDTEKASGLFQGSKDFLTSDQGKKDDVVAEEQSRENQDEGMRSEAEVKGGQSYFEKLYAAKNVIASKLGYGALPTEEKVPVEESKEDKPQGPKTERVASGASLVTEKDYPGTE